MSCQMLSELEEVIQYKLVPERRDIIRETWWERLQVTTVHDKWTHKHMLAHTKIHVCNYKCKADVGKATVTNGKHYKPDTMHTCKGIVQRLIPSE